MYALLFTLHASKQHGGTVKISEFKRWLESQGVEVREGTRHWKLYYQGNQSTLPRHPSKELKEGTRRAILKQLGL
jgi:mRNA interferase HicA